MRILIVGMGGILTRVMERGLRKYGFAVSVIAPEHITECAEAGGFDIGLVDGESLGGQCEGVCRVLRKDGRGAPVLLVTGTPEEAGSRASRGAEVDGYLVMPFGFEELIASVRLLTA